MIMFECRTRVAWTYVSGTTTPGGAGASWWMPPLAGTRWAKCPMPIFAIISTPLPVRIACRLTRAPPRTETDLQRLAAAPKEGHWVFTLFGKGWEWPIFHLQGAPAYFILISILSRADVVTHVGYWPNCLSQIDPIIVPCFAYRQP
jgi:hypothetical protein